MWPFTPKYHPHSLDVFLEDNSIMPTLFQLLVFKKSF